MSLVKKIFKHGPEDQRDDRRGTALAKRREGGGLLKRRHRLGADRGVGDLWRDFGRDPWDLARDPWSMFDRLNERLGTLTAWPAVDVSEDDNAVTVHCDVPGLDAKDLDVQVSGNLLTVSGSREDEWSDDGRKRGVRRRERVSGSFSRTITLPAYVDADRVEARYDKGTLTVTVPKIPGKGPRRVAVQGG